MSGQYAENREISTQNEFHVHAEDLQQSLRENVGGSVQSYRVRCGYEPIKLDGIEFRILKFLSSKPYHPFTPAKIVEAVSTEQQPVTEETLRDHIRSLREKLGFFRDYVQTVPYIGYRFKE